MSPEQWALVARLAATQDALVTRRQLMELGCPPRTLERCLERGQLVAVRRGVFAIAGSPPTVWRDLRAALLAAGPDAAASHFAAGGLHAFPGIAPGAVEVTAAGTRQRALHGVRSHSTATFAPGDLTVVEGMAATSPVRTIADLAPRLDGEPRFLANVVNDACRRRLCSQSGLERYVERLAGPGHAGVAALRRVLADRAGGDSGLEDRWLCLLRKAGYEPPALQYQVVIDGRVFVLDFAWPSHRVGIEVDGWAAHGNRPAWDHDHDKINAYLAARWRVLFVTSNSKPALVLRQLGAFIGE